MITRQTRHVTFIVTPELERIIRKQKYATGHYTVSRQIAHIIVAVCNEGFDTEHGDEWIPQLMKGVVMKRITEEAEARNEKSLPLWPSLNVALSRNETHQKVLAVCDYIHAYTKWFAQNKTLTDQLKWESRGLVVE